MASTSDRFAEDKHLLARVDDAFEISERRYTPHFVGFLDERQAMLVRSRISVNDTRCCFYGGHEEAERVMFGVFPDGFDPLREMFPLTCVAFLYGMPSTLSHRDVLGSLLASGIAREKIGDILCASDRAVVFLHDDLVAFVADNIRKIGNVGVTVVAPYDGELPVFHRFEPITGTVASARLDAVLKVLLNVSREQAAQRIRESLVQVNHQPVQSVSCTVTQGQILSVRGSGRFVVDELSQTTKKGRLILKARKYV